MAATTARSETAGRSDPPVFRLRLSLELIFVDIILPRPKASSIFT
jgi:hypothetical protein